MKKIFKFLISLILVLCVSRVNAEEITYSDWSILYPSGLDDSFIQSEDRYHFYRVVDNKIEYTDEYYVNLDGYIKDEKSKKTFYRYITNKMLVFNNKNEIVLENIDYCKKNYCYFKLFTEPTLVDLSEKEEIDYSDSPMFEIVPTVVPMTNDNITIFIVIFTISIFTLILLLVIKRRKMSYE